MLTNKLLARLSRADAGLLEPHLVPVDLPVRKQLQAAKRRVERVYFLKSGIASIVANGGNPIEVGMIGREGMTGVSVLLGNGDRVPHEVYMQIAGRGLHLPADRLREAIAKSVSLHQVLLRFVHDFLTQTTQTALANGRSVSVWHLGSRASRCSELRLVEGVAGLGFPTSQRMGSAWH